MLRAGLLRAFDSRAQTPIMPFVGFFSRMSLLAGLLLGAVLPLMRLWAVRLRERRGCDERAGGLSWGEAGCGGIALLLLAVGEEEEPWA